VTLWYMFQAGRLAHADSRVFCVYLYLFCIRVVTSCNNGLIQICTSRKQSN